ncbi:hypothetical protein MJL79_31350, partial [Salmonella enterica subsp. enterica serovar Montevideo]|nr:hypothetical protein [Salmonella enterica subsp. enterica serovar Montevideo]
TTTGGNALKFYASVRLDIRRIGAVKEGDNVVGSETRVKVVKKIELLHNLYAPTRKEVAHARLVVEAAEAAAREGLGVVSLNGK